MIVVTGAAGFVGSHAARFLVGRGHDVLATDLVAPDAAIRLRDLATAPTFRYLPGPLTVLLPEVLRGAYEVWHFAANADIPLGIRDTSVDLRESVLLTHQVLEAMRQHDVPTILFPSTSGVYGNRTRPLVRETDGPLLPNSLYAAGKVATEAMISAFAQSFGVRGLIFRLGNVVGGGMSRGIVRDFIGKLQQDPSTLRVLGDGRQRKSYVLVDDVVAGMRKISALPALPPCSVWNLAAGGSVAVRGVADAVAQAMELPPPRIVASREALSWRGDQPTVELDIGKALATGWSPKASAQEALLTAARRLLMEAGVPGQPMGGA